MAPGFMDMKWRYGVHDHRRCDRTDLDLKIYTFGIMYPWVTPNLDLGIVSSSC